MECRYGCNAYGYLCRKFSEVVRTLETIPHPTYRISIHSYNGKYLLEFQVADLKQVYTIPENRVKGVDQIREIVTDDLIEGVTRRFKEMRDDFISAYQQSIRP